jgi:phage tail tape-measure protein
VEAELITDRVSPEGTAMGVNIKGEAKSAQKKLIGVEKLIAKADETSPKQNKLEQEQEQQNKLQQDQQQQKRVQEKQQQEEHEYREQQQEQQEE